MAVEVFNAAGTYTWVAPSWITTVDILAIGAGGAGGLGAGNGGGGGGGGASAATAAVPVTAGNSYTITVGAGDIAGIGGGDSSFGATVIAKGGGGATAFTAAAGGSGAASTGTTKFSGGSGGTGQAGVSGSGAGGGSSAGTTAVGGTGADGASGGAGGTAPDAAAGAGGAGSVFNTGSPVNGQNPGGGGGGTDAAFPLLRGNGADGLVQLTYADPPGPSTANVVFVPSPQTPARLLQMLSVIMNSLGRRGSLTQSDVLEFNIPYPGLLCPFAGSGTPPGWLLCDGKFYNTADYPELFAVIGYSYGGGGAQFAVPNLVGHTI